MNIGWQHDSMRVPLAKSEVQESSFHSNLFEKNDTNKIANRFNRFAKLLVVADLVCDLCLGRGRQHLC